MSQVVWEGEMNSLHLVYE